MRDVQGRLRTMRVCTDGSVSTLIGCWLMNRVASHLCTAAPGLFWRPYYNTPLVPMLRALADAQIIRIYAMLCGSALCKSCRMAGKHQSACTKPLCGKSLAEGIGLRGLEDLKNHRDVLCHPLTFQLDRAGVRKFVDADRDRADVRPALVWDIHRSIVEAQAAAGMSATVVDIDMGPYQSTALASILRLCWREGALPFSDAALAEWMMEFWKKDRVAFEDHPDGQFPRKTDAELAALYEEMKAAWEKSRVKTPVKRRRRSAP